MNKVFNILGLNVLTFISLLRSYPSRVVRLFIHFLQWMPKVQRYHLRSKTITEWFCDFACYLADLFLIPDIFEFILVWINPNIRLLNESERKYVKKYFHDNVQLGNIRINKEMPKKIQSLALAFVSFNTIHYAKKISLPIFIHEVVHIWQYQKYGSVYIYRSLKAQRSEEGYNYGGLEALYSKMLSNHMFIDFNFEQQGEIFEDYCRLKESRNEINSIAEASYEYFVGQIRDQNLA